MVARTRAPDRRRGDLLDAAEAIILDRGLPALTVDEVTSSAGVAKGTFYLYFRSKEEVIAGLQERFVDQVLALQAAALADVPADDWGARLETWIVAGIRGYLEHVGLHDALFHHVAAGKEITTAASPANRHLDALRDLLAEGAATGGYAVQSPNAAAVLLYSAMHGAADYAVHHDQTLDPEQLVETARQLCRGLVEKR
jgi:AcrR family transcriptional regulator